MVLSHGLEKCDTQATYGPLRVSAAREHYFFNGMQSKKEQPAAREFQQRTLYIWRLEIKCKKVRK